MNQPAVDVLMPVYNSADTLAHSLESIMVQSHDAARIIAIDDGSTDASGAILEHAARHDGRIKVIKTPNRGIVEALNLGLTHCRADYVARFDADDVAYPARLGRQLQYLEDHEDCVAVGCDVDHIDEAGAPIVGLPLPGPPALADPAWLPAREPYLIHPFMMARRAALEAIGGYRAVHYSEDSDLYWRLSEIGRLHNMSERLGQYRMRRGISGGSIVNGRIMAVHAQLGAISALRRLAGRVDLVFPTAPVSAFRNATHLDRMVALASKDLNTEEAYRLRLGAAAKLLELAAYRPYELEREDCHFVGAQLRRLRNLGSNNRAHIAWCVLEAGARLMRAGRFRDALLFVPPAWLPKLLAKLTLRRAGRGKHALAHRG